MQFVSISNVLAFIETIFEMKHKFLCTPEHHFWTLRVAKASCLIFDPILELGTLATRLFIKKRAKKRIC